jgi:hypothetical protein
LVCRALAQVFFDSLPDYAFTAEVDEVEKFFNV